MDGTGELSGFGVADQKLWREFRWSRTQAGPENERQPKQLRKVILPSTNRLSRLEFHQLNLGVVSRRSEAARRQLTGPI